jgi:AcrR family transcriptional regulator
MARKAQAIVLSRRAPTQARARQTIETIFEATARIIERDGAAALNTNRIAERAGISIGTLYEYFPNKQAVLIAMARRQLAEDARVVEDILSAALELPGASIARLVIRALAKLHQTRPKVRRAIMAVHLASGLGAEHARPVQEAAQLLASRGGILADGRNPVSPAALFVVTRAVVGVLRAAFEEQSPLLGQPELEDELTALIETYIDRPRNRERVRAPT